MPFQTNTVGPIQSTHGSPVQFDLEELEELDLLLELPEEEDLLDPDDKLGRLDEELDDLLEKLDEELFDENDDEDEELLEDLEL